MAELYKAEEQHILSRPTEIFLFIKIIYRQVKFTKLKKNSNIRVRNPNLHLKQI